MTAPVALLVMVAICTVAVIPVFANRFVSLNDVYNHVARIPVLAHYNQGVDFRQYWQPNWRLVPYLGYDLVALALYPWLGLNMIVKVMLAVTLLSMLAGAMVLSRAVHRTWSAASLLCAILLLNRTFLSGFINYLFGVGVCLMGAAAWISLRDRPAAIRMLVLAAFALVLCAIHLFACGVLGLTIFGIELAIVAEARSGLTRSLAALAIPVLAFIPAFCVVAFVAPHPGFHFVYGSLSMHLAAFAVPLTYAPAFEAAGIALIAATLLALWLSGRVAVDRRLAVAAALLALAQFAVPSELGTATVVDHRIPIAFWLVVICALDVRLESSWQARSFVALVAMVFISRIAVVQNQWARDNLVYAEADRDMSLLPGTARVAAAYPLSGLNKASRPAVALYYMPALEYVPSGGFTQILWTIPDQHPLVMQPAYQQLASATAPDVLWQVLVTQQDVSPALQSRVDAALQDYDYVVFLDAEPFKVKPITWLEPLVTGSAIRIERIRHSDDRNPHTLAGGHG